MKTRINGHNVIHQSIIHWKPVRSLFILELTVVMSWIAFFTFQPSLIKNFGHTGFSFYFLLVQTLVLVSVPPLAGFLADRLSKKQGHSLALISVGITLVALIFLLIAGFIYLQPTGTASVLLPVFIILWLILMSVFRSPAISLLEVYVPRDKIPGVVAILMLATNLIFALQPSISATFKWMGGSLTFLSGGILIFAAGFFFFREVVLFRIHPKGKAYQNNTKDGRSGFGMVVLISAMLGISAGFMFNLMPALIEQKSSFMKETGSGQVTVSLLIGISAFFSYFIGKMLKRSNIENAAWFGYLFMASLAIFLMVVESEWAFWSLLILLPPVFALVTVTGLPLVLFQLNSRNKIFGIGIMYGTAAFTKGLIEIFQL